MSYTGGAIVGTDLLAQPASKGVFLGQTAQ